MSASEGARCPECRLLYSEKAHRCMGCGHSIHYHVSSGWSIDCECGESVGGHLVSYEVPDPLPVPPKEAEP